MKRGSQQQIKNQTHSCKHCCQDEDDGQSKVIPFSDGVDEVVTEKDHKLMNLTQLANELNVSYDFTKDMRTMGFPLPIGGMTTLTFAMTWLNQNPNFREDARILKLSKSPKRF